jgi:hypothetical protein
MVPRPMPYDADATKDRNAGSPLTPTIQMHGYVNYTTNRFGNGHNRNQSRSESAGDGFG